MSAKYTFLAWDTPIENAPLKLALLQLANNADDDGFSYYSISKMAFSCGMSERTFMRKISELEKMKVLTVNRRANRTSLYTLVGDEMGVTLCHLQESGVTECHGGVTESHLVGDRESHDLNSTPNTNPNICVSPSESDIKKERLAEIKKDGFDSFYSGYPKKVARPAAEKAFKAKTKGMNEEQLFDFVDQIMLNSQTAYKETEKNFIPNPATYLNQERYNDE